MEWTSEHIAELEGFPLGSERGGHERSAVDLLVSNAAACMRAGRQLPDPTTFALPTRRFGSGYARADVRRLVDRMHRWRSEWSPATAPDAATTPVSRPVSTTTRRRWTQSQIDWVRDRQFTVRRGGYVTADVDDFLDAVIVAMAHAQPLPDVQSVKFTAAGIKPGYVYTEVDDFLDELSRQQPARAD